jgi:hypothetical protein
MSHLVLIWDRSGFIVRTPSPYTLETAIDHLSKLEPHISARLEIRTYEELGRESYSMRPEARDERPTLPAPAPREGEVQNG